MAHEIIQDDAFVRMDAMALIGEQFHSIVTDPPYGLGSWDWIKHGDQLHDWHGRWAKLALALVPPGGHMAVFSGTKHFHHMMLAVEDAGWELRDTLLWLKAGGMPKSRNRGPMGTGLKPGWEPIALFRKPLDGTIFETFDRHDTGMLHIDACRLPTDESLGGGDQSGNRLRVKTNEHFESPWMKDPEHVKRHAESVRENVKKAEKLGRWPANVVLDLDAAQELDLQTGELSSGSGLKRRRPTRGSSLGYFAGQSDETDITTYGDSGGASRFFYCAKAAPGERDAGLPDGMKNKHPTVKPIALMQWLTRLLTIPGGRVLDPFAGSGSSGCAAVLDGFDWVGIEEDAESATVARYRIDHWAST